MQIILASKSPRRKELLEQLDLSFEVKSADVDETMDVNIDVYQNVMNVAYSKGLEVFKMNPESLVISADTIVVLDGVIYGKPKDNMDAFMMLTKLNNKTHSVITGVTIINKDQKSVFYVESFVTFKNNTDEEILDYVKTKEPLDKAGSYAIQGIGKCLVDNFSGDLNNIIGLPLDKVKEELKKFI